MGQLMWKKKKTKYIFFLIPLPRSICFITLPWWNSNINNIVSLTVFYAKIAWRDGHIKLNLFSAFFFFFFACFSFVYQLCIISGEVLCPALHMHTDIVQATDCIVIIFLLLLLDFNSVEMSELFKLLLIEVDILKSTFYKHSAQQK